MHVHCQFRSVPIREQEKQLLANQVYDIQCNMVRGAVPVNMMNVTRGNMTTVSRGNGAAGAKDDEWDFVGSEEWPTPPNSPMYSGDDSVWGGEDETQAGKLDFPVDMFDSESEAEIVD